MTERYARKLDSTLVDAVRGTAGPSLTPGATSNSLSRLSDLNRRPVLYESLDEPSGSVAVEAAGAPTRDHATPAAWSLALAAEAALKGRVLVGTVRLPGRVKRRKGAKRVG